MTREQIHTAFRIVVIMAILILGIICEALGIHMLYQQTVLFKIASVDFSAAPLLLIIGLVLIVFTLNTFSKSNIGQNPQESWLARNWLILLAILIAIVLLAAFVKMNYKPNAADKYNLLVNLILIIIGITAAVGYGIFRWISRNIEEQARTLVNQDRNLAMAQVYSSLGYLWFEYYETEEERRKEMEELRKKLEKIKPNLEDKEKAETDSHLTVDYMERAIRNAERALKHANKLAEVKHEEVICRCKSNLSYYLTERQRKKRDFKDKETALELALYAYQVAREKRALQYVRPYNWEETYAWVLWHFAKDENKEAKEKARQIIDELQERINIPDDWHERIEKKWAKLAKINNT